MLGNFRVKKDLKKTAPNNNGRYKIIFSIVYLFLFLVKIQLRNLIRSKTQYPSFRKIWKIWSSFVWFQALGRFPVKLTKNLKNRYPYPRKALNTSFGHLWVKIVVRGRLFFLFLVKIQLLNSIRSKNNFFPKKIFF